MASFLGVFLFGELLCSGLASMASVVAFRRSNSAKALVLATMVSVGVACECVTVRVIVSMCGCGGHVREWQMRVRDVPGVWSFVILVEVEWPRVTTCRCSLRLPSLTPLSHPRNLHLQPSPPWPPYPAPCPTGLLPAREPCIPLCAGFTFSSGRCGRWCDPGLPSCPYVRPQHWCERGHGGWGHPGLYPACGQRGPQGPHARELGRLGQQRGCWDRLWCVVLEAKGVEGGGVVLCLGCVCDAWVVFLASYVALYVVWP